MTVKASEVLARLNGVSTPIGGVSWVPPVVDRDVARRVLVVIEARRVLFSSYTEEVPDECAHSVIDIRNFLTEVIGNGGIGPNLEQPVRLMRRYCVRFLEKVGISERDVPKDARDRQLYHEPRFRMHDYFFGEALGELRAGIGLQAGIIAARYGLDVEDDLAAMIPWS